MLHRLVPVEVFGGIDYHHKSSAENVNLHLKDAYGTNAVAYLFPMELFGVPLAIFSNHVRIIAQVSCLYVTFGLHLLLVEIFALYENIVTLLYSLLPSDDQWNGFLVLLAESVSIFYYEG